MPIVASYVKPRRHRKVDHCHNSPQIINNYGNFCCATTYDFTVVLLVHHLLTWLREHQLQQNNDQRQRNTECCHSQRLGCEHCHCQQPNASLCNGTHRLNTQHWYNEEPCRHLSSICRNKTHAVILPILSNVNSSSNYITTCTRIHDPVNKPS